MNSVNKYLLILGSSIALVPLVALLNYIFLRNAYEFEPIDNVVNLQSQNEALYLPAIHQTIYPYKLVLYHKIKPKIVALGSSRVHRIRGRYFNVPFVNLGGAMYTLKEGQRLLKEMAATHKPDLILLGLDPWWFGSMAGTYSAGDCNVTGSEFQLDMLFLPCKWLLERKVSFQNFFQILMGQHHNPTLAIGLHAAINGEGFYRDGSLYNYGRVFGFYKRSDGGFAGERDLISRGMGIFNYDRAIIQERWQEFISLLEFAKAQNIQVITFLLPLPARVIDWMAELKDNYAYIDELRAKIPEVSVRNFDFFDPREFGSCDCEFFDGFHGGEITDLRMLREMGRDSASGLGPYLNWPRIEECIQKYRGKTLVPIHSYGPQYKEVDFLKLGCKKD
jgi:hypothetical protein